MKRGAKRIFSRNKLLPGLIGCAVILALIIAATSAGMAGIETEEELVERLVCLRNDAMIGYFASQLDWWEARKMLEEAEAGQALESDLEALRGFFRTDIDEITRYEITDIKLNYSSEDLICALVTISWETAGLDGEAKFPAAYSVICQAEEVQPEKEEKTAENSQKTFKIVEFF